MKRESKRERDYWNTGENDGDVTLFKQRREGKSHQSQVRR